MYRTLDRTTIAGKERIYSCRSLTEAARTLRTAPLESMTTFPSGSTKRKDGAGTINSRAWPLFQEIWTMRL